jgi:ribosome-binding factor A
MALAGHRPERVGEQIREEVAEIVAGELTDPRIGLVAVTEVRVSSDLKHATVFVSLTGTSEEQQASLKGLEAAVGYIRRELAQRLAMRRVPELVFRRDDSAEIGQRIEELLKEAREGSEKPGDE